MIIYNDFEQGGEEWLNIRAGIPTASEFVRIFTGGGKESTQRGAFMRQCAVARKYEIPDTFTGNEWTDRGHELEPVARDIFREQTGFDVREDSFAKSEEYCAGYSPDSHLYDSRGNFVGGQEIKCFNYDKHLGIVDKGAMPTAHNPQVHGSLAISGAEVWVFTVYNPDAEPFTFETFEITPNQYTQDIGGHLKEFCEELDRRETEFIEDYEQRRSGICTARRLPVLFKLMEQAQTAAPALELESLI